MPTIQELKASGGKTVAEIQAENNTSTPGSAPGTPGLTMDQIRASGGKTVAEIQAENNTPSNQTQPASLSPGANLPGSNFNPVKDILGIGKPQQGGGFIPDIIQSTVGSKGLAGTAQLPGKTIAALSEYGPGGAHQGEQLNNKATELYNRATDLLSQARLQTDPKKQAQMRASAKDLMQNADDLKQNAEDIGALTNTTPKQAMGTTLNSELTLAAGGTDSLLGETGLKIAKPLVAGTSDIFASTKYARLGVRALEEGVYGAGFQAAYNLNEGKPLSENMGTSALWGGLIPIALTGASGLKSSIQKGAELSSEGIINRIIKPAVKDVGYGKEPARGILNEGITANSLSDLKNKVSSKINEIGLGIWQVGDQVQNILGNTLDLTPSLKPLDDAMNQAAKLNNSTLLNRLNDIKIALTHELGLVVDKDGNPSIKMGDARNLIATGYKDAVALMKDVQAHTQWTNNPSDDKILNVTGQKVQQSLRTIMNNAADKADPQLGIQIRNLNQRFGDMMGAAGAISHREIVAQRNNYFSLAAKAGILSGIAATAIPDIVTGNWASAGLKLAGDAGLLGLSKVVSSPAVQMRTAKFLDMLSPLERQGILNSTPVLKNLYTTLTGGQESRAGIEKTMPKKAVDTVANKIGINSENIDKLKTFMGLGQKAAEKAGMGEDYRKILEHISSKDNIDPELGF